MKATTLLETQHRQVATLIEELEKPGADKRSLVEQLATVIAAHMLIEEELFYPAVLKLQPEIVRQSFEDHESELPVLHRLLEAGDDGSTFAARLQVLKGLLQQHVNREESVLFTTVNREVDPQKHQALGRDMQQRFDDISRTGCEQVLMLRLTRSMQIGRIAIGTSCVGSPKDMSEDNRSGQS